MAIIKKTLFPENLEKYNTFVRDTDINSKYFNITELSDTLTGGKNAFLIQGSEYLVPDTLIKIEIKDSEGNIIYHEPGEGIVSASVGGEPIVTEYFEGVSKVVSVYVYPDTLFGPATITILGEVSKYDNNGLLAPIPLEWEGKYNVKWQRQVNINPTLPNTTKIRFYKRPSVSITEILSPIYTIVGDTKVASAVTQSFANIKLSNLETFAGDVKRVKVFRTSIGDISDYDLIQDILVESKELMTSYGLSGSVVGNTGIFTSEVLKNQWNSGSLTAVLDSSRVESGVRLTGNGNFRYTQSLDLKSANTYELNLDAFYSASTNSNLGIYLSQVTTSTDGITPLTISSSIATLIGTQPTKNLSDTVIPFKLDRNYPTASLYFSQSQGQWHLGNVSLKLSEDTAFSPDEISFVTTMPTVLGNETFNFKFEFYDVNNNYVPVAVTQSATFNGGNTNIGGTILLISSSASSSLADLNRVSSSISGTVTFTSASISGTLGSVSSSVSGTIGIVSSSVSGTIGNVSSSVSGTITTLSGSVSQSVAFSLSSSLSKVKQLADGQYPGVFIDGTTVFAPVIGGTTGYISQLFTVGSTAASTINLDARTTTRKIWIGSGANGTYNDSATGVYLDSSGKFSLKDKLTWDGSTLSITGNLNVGSSVPNSVVTGLGGLATKSSVSATEIDAGAVTEAKIGTSAVSNAKIAADAVTEGKIAVNAITEGKIAANAVVADKIAANAVVADKIAAGAITAGKISAGAIEADKIAAGAITAGKIAAGAIEADKIAAGAITAGKIAAGAVTADKVDVAGVISAGSIVIAGNGVSRLTNDSAYQANGDAKTAGSVGGWAITSTQIQGGSPSGGGDGSYTSSGIRLGSGGWISAKNFYIDSSGNAGFKGTLSVTSGTIGGWNIGSNSLSSNSNVINLFASDAGSGYTYGWIQVSGDASIYIGGNNSSFNWFGGSFRECTMPQYETASGLADWFAFRARSQNAGENAIKATSFNTNTWGVHSNGKIGGSGFHNTSDRRIKSDIKQLDNKFGVDFIKKLNPVEFKFNDDLAHTKFGFVAQDVTSSLAEYGLDISNSSLVDGKPNNPRTLLHVSYTELVAPLVLCVQQLSQKIENLESYISSSIK